MVQEEVVGWEVDRLLEPYQWLWWCWWKHLDAIPISGIQSDQLYGIRIKLYGTSITVIGVYLPCAGSNIQAYGSHLIELERLVTEDQTAGLVYIVGDFNAHTGVLDGVYSQNNDINPEGLLNKSLG